MIDAKKRVQVDTLREAIRLRKVDPKLADVDRGLSWTVCAETCRAKLMR